MSLRALSGLARRLLLVVAVVALALPAAAHDGEDHPCYYTTFDAEGNPTGPAYCTQQVWFHQAETKAGNLAATGASGFPTWDTNKPTASVASGAGGGYLTNGAEWQLQGTRNDATGATFEGGFTGAIDNIGVELYMLAPGKQQDPTYNLGFILEVDGKQVARMDTLEVPLKPDGNAALRANFVMTEVTAAMERAEVPTGDGVEHDLRLYVTAYPIASTTGIFVYDTTEVPSGLTFNIPGELEESHFTVPLW